MLPPIPPDPSASMQQLQATAKFALEMLQDSRAQEQKNKQILDEISQVLRQSDPRPQAEVAGPAKPDGPESQDRQDLESQNLTGEPSTMNPTFLRHDCEPAFGSSPEASPSLSRSSRELSLATPWRSPQIVTCPSQDFGWPLIPASSERKD
eukprot:s2839_g11.t2